MSNKKPRGPDLNFRHYTDLAGMTPQSTHKRDVANFERVKAGRPLKPPRKRSA